MRRLIGMGIAVVCSLLARADGFEEQVRSFSANRHALARDLAKRLELPMPAEVESFFETARTGPWEVVSNRSERLFAGETKRRLLENALWAPVHETLGLWEVWAGWKGDSTLLALFHEPVMAVLPAKSVYFGGTDYGRFVITAVNALNPTSTVICLTQNALVDMTYMEHLRVVHGKDLVLPTPEEANGVFGRYVEEVRTGKRKKSGSIEIENGRVTISGVLGVMEINGMLAQLIFEKNRNARPFFVEESYVLDWMYPYMEPCGLILKLNPQPLDALAPEMIDRDRRFWAGQEKKLTAHPGFADNAEARKAFAKLRSAIGALYAYRGLFAEAEAAYRQAIRLSPTLPEARFRLAELYANRMQYDEAKRLMQEYEATAPADIRPQITAYLADLAKRVEEKADAPK